VVLAHGGFGGEAHSLVEHREQPRAEDAHEPRLVVIIIIIIIIIRIRIRIIRIIIIIIIINNHRITKPKFL
jgi:hypothetical protein